DDPNIRVYLNGVLVNDFVSTDPARDLSSGFIGLQNHGGSDSVSFRDVRIKALEEPAEPVLVPVEQVSVQMFSLIPWVNADGLPAVLERLASIGFENIEPYGGNFNGYTAQEFRAMTDALGLRIPSSHYDTNEASFDETLAFVEALGQEYVGSGGFASPGIGSYENTLATAETMNRLGERAVEAGFEKFFGHNHAGEFTTTYEHEGEVMSAWEILVAETNPEWVTFELDVAWAAHAGIDVADLIEEHGDRIELLHIKDATNLGGPGNPVFTNLGEGDVDLQGILAAAQDADIAYYVLEYDRAPDGEEFVTSGFEYLTGLPAGEPDPEPEPLEVSVETSARCVVGRTVLTARVTNGEGVPVSAEVA
ncbi:TIM barrel protein, partial [Georgenia wangjunii]|uniref:TIM barrel protein n=1 Tax=Georgenia wangjunii TaxID=3117730 RepID=UPI002F265F4A